MQFEPSSRSFLVNLLPCRRSKQQMTSPVWTFRILWTISMTKQQPLAWNKTVFGKTFEQCEICPTYQKKFGAGVKAFMLMLLLKLSIPVSCHLTIVSSIMQGFWTLKEKKNLLVTLLNFCHKYSDLLQLTLHRRISCKRNSQIINFWIHVGNSWCDLERSTNLQRRNWHCLWQKSNTTEWMYM